MKKEENNIYQLVVPVELILDVTQIILQSGMTNSIEDIKRSKGSIVIEVQIDNGQQEAYNNIEEMILEFNHYRYSDPYENPS